ncbi:unnamed protein product [Rotaria sp. Silwood1]|nr:unnamed protein product [Rotaria sp. Silwood1]
MMNEKDKLRPEQEMQVCQIILDGATQQQIYEHLFALLAVELYQYDTVDSLENVQLRNVAKFFAHLIFNKAISWGVLDSFHSIEEGTTSSAIIILAIHAYYSHAIKLNISDPLSLDVAVIDASILLYDVQQETVQVNRFTTILIGLRTLAETKQSSSINDDNVNKSACIFVMQTLSHQNSILCCVADEILGNLTQVICDGHFVADIAQIYFDRLKEFHDISSHTGYLLALECLHRYIDGDSTELYLNLSLSILLVLGKDQSTSIVQV